MRKYLSMAIMAACMVLFSSFSVVSSQSSLHSPPKQNAFTFIGTTQLTFTSTPPSGLEAWADVYFDGFYYSVTIRLVNGMSELPCFPTGDITVEYGNSVVTNGVIIYYSGTNSIGVADMAYYL